MSPDKLINAFDKTLRIFSGISSAHRPYPSATLAIGALSEADRRHSAGVRAGFVSGAKSFCA